MGLEPNSDWDGVAGGGASGGLRAGGGGSQASEPAEAGACKRFGRAESISAVLSLSDQAWPWVGDFDDDGDHDLLVGGFPCQDYSVARTVSGELGIKGENVTSSGLKPNTFFTWWTWK